MKAKRITCDICGKDITAADFRYKAKTKIKEYEDTYMNQEDFDFTKWKKLDICNLCMFLFWEWAKEREKEK